MLWRYMYNNLHSTTPSHNTQKRPSSSITTSQYSQKQHPTSAERSMIFWRHLLVLSLGRCCYCWLLPLFWSSHTIFPLLRMGSKRWGRHCNCIYIGCTEQHEHQIQQEPSTTAAAAVSERKFTNPFRDGWAFVARRRRRRHIVVMHRRSSVNTNRDWREFS